MSMVWLGLLIVAEPLHDAPIGSNGSRHQFGEGADKGVCKCSFSQSLGRGTGIGEELSDDLVIHRRACTDGHDRAIGSEVMVLR